MVIAYAAVIPLAQPLKECNITVEVAKLFQVGGEGVRKALDMMLGRVMPLRAVPDDKLVVVISDKVYEIGGVGLENEEFSCVCEEVLLLVFESLEEEAFIFRDIVARHALKEGHVRRPQFIFCIFIAPEAICYKIGDKLYWRF